MGQISTKGDNQNDRKGREEREVKENQSYLQIWINGSLGLCQSPSEKDDILKFT